jgi:RHS repeat-associated protein
MGWDPIAVIEGGVVSFVRADHIGRPVYATNASGVKVWSATYNPFGGVTTSTGTVPTARFPGQWFQSESGLHQNWMRDYDPTTGRYLQADPLGLVDGASVYGYVGQNPGRHIDPTGQWIQPPGTGGAACNNSDRCVVMWTDNEGAAPGNGLYLLRPGQCTGQVKPWRRDVADFMYHDGKWYKCRAFGTCYANQDGSVAQNGCVTPTDNKPTWDEEGTQDEMPTNSYTPAAEALLDEECENCE